MGCCPPNQLWNPIHLLSLWTGLHWAGSTAAQMHGGISSSMESVSHIVIQVRHTLTHVKALMTEDEPQFHLWLLEDNNQQLKAPNKWVNYISVIDGYLSTERNAQSIESELVKFKDDKQFSYMKGCLPCAPLCNTMVLLSKIPWFQQETRVTVVSTGDKSDRVQKMGPEWDASSGYLMSE